MSHRKLQHPMSSRAHVRLSLTCLLSALGLIACSNSESTPAGSPALFSGGDFGSTGAVVASGGLLVPTGGTTVTGGSSATGGVGVTGGDSFSGGFQVSGGFQFTGGVGDLTGGTASTGGDVGATGGDMAASGGDMSVTGGDVGATGGTTTDLPKGSFFVTSLESMRELSGSQDGFGGDLGGIAGADSICQQIAAKVGLGAKTWRAFLSAHDDGTGNRVDAIDRIGQGPWYDVNGRLISEDIAGLLNERPDGDPQAVDDLPNEFGEPQKQFGDNHDTLTGSNTEGRLDNPGEPSSTCNSWTSTTVTPSGGLALGHSWPRNNRSGREWISDHSARSCAAGVHLIQDGGGDGSSVGAGGGYGGIYCFALEP